MKIYISVQGGVVSEVRTDKKIDNMEVVVVDYDAASDNDEYKDEVLTPYEKIQEELEWIY